MRPRGIEAYDRTEVEAVLEAIDVKLNTILQLLESQNRVSKPGQVTTPSAQTVPRLALAINEAAKAIGISRDSLRRRISEGKLRAFRFGRRLLIRREDLEKLISG
jgi:excisionase family DNA binding protein